MASTPTKISVVEQAPVDNSVMGTVAPAPVVTARLYRRSGSKLYPLAGRVKCYLIDQDTGRRTLVGTAMGPRASIALPQAGYYKWVFSATRTYKAASAFTLRVDTVGPALTTPTVSVEPVDDEFSVVTASYDLTWNTAAYSGPFVLVHIGSFSGPPHTSAPYIGYGADEFEFVRIVESPEVVEFRYWVRTTQVTGVFYTLSAAASRGYGSVQLAGDEEVRHTHVLP